MTIVMKAAAKINLSLDVTGRRADGYHTLDSVMQSVALYDHVRLTTHAGTTVSVTALSGPQQEENVCYRAASAFFQAAGISDGVEIFVEKAIPLAAGLGGGSADAAAVLWGLNERYRRPLTPERLSQLALSLGADVPFFLQGGCCRARGVGELLTPLTTSLSYALVLVKAGQKASTGEQYQALDRRGAAVFSTEKTVDALQNNDYDVFVTSLDNAFLAVNPQAQTVCRALKDAGADGVNLTGSGPTVYGVFADINAALSAASTLRAVYPLVYTALPCDTAISLE